MQAPTSTHFARKASSNAVNTRPSCFRARAGARQQRAVQMAALMGAADAAVARRHALGMLIGASLLSGSPAYAAFSGTPTVCADQDTGEAADECRAKILARDAGNQEDYSKFEGRTSRVVQGVPVSVIDDEYTRSTLDLAEKLETYFVIDVYDKQRVPLIKQIKADSQAWVSKYARGGSVRKQSARRFYIAVDTVLGHLASNGLAPFPARKAGTVKGSIEEAKALLADGK